MHGEPGWGHHVMKDRLNVTLTSILAPWCSSGAQVMGVSGMPAADSNKVACVPCQECCFVVTALHPGWHILKQHFC